MERNTKILIGLAAAGVVAYLVLKPKKAIASAPISQKKLTPKVITEDIKKELPVENVKEVPKETTPIVVEPSTPATPITPTTPITPSKPIEITPGTPIIPPTPSEPEAPIIPQIPDFDFEKYFKEHPIEFNIDPNVGSTMVVNPPAYGNTDPFAQYNNCIPLEQYMDLKSRGVPMSPNVCIEGTGNPISEKDRLQNAFQMKDFKNELSRDAFGDLNSFMQQGADFNIFRGDELAGDNYTTSGGGGWGGIGLSERQRDLFRMGYGGDFSA